MSFCGWPGALFEHVRGCLAGTIVHDGQDVWLASHPRGHGYGEEDCDCWG
jgi:hypothetical protein